MASLIPQEDLLQFLHLTDRPSKVCGLCNKKRQSWFSIYLGTWVCDACYNREEERRLYV